MDLGLKGKRAIITGASRGIGRAIAEALAKEGVTVAICARDGDAVQEAIGAINETGGKAIGGACNVKDAEEYKGWLESMVAELGGCDIFVPNVSGGGGMDSEKNWWRNFEIDVLHTVRGCETLLPALKESGAGSVVLIGSTNAVDYFGGPMASTAQVIEHELKPYLLGEDPGEIERLWELMHRRAYKHARGGIVIAAISGIDIALWDLRGKAAGMPVWRLLGGYRKRVPAYATGGFYAEGKGIKELMSEMETYTSAGFRAVKMKVGRNSAIELSALRASGERGIAEVSLAEDIERVAAVREAIGPDIRLAVDANGAWDVATGQPHWRAPLLLPRDDGPPLVFTHQGWIVPGQGPARVDLAKKAWRLAAQAAQAASLDGTTVCTLSAGDRLELWDRGADRLSLRAGESVTVRIRSDFIRLSISINLIFCTRSRNIRSETFGSAQNCHGSRYASTTLFFLKIGYGTFMKSFTTATLMVGNPVLSNSYALGQPYTITPS